MWGFPNLSLSVFSSIKNYENILTKIILKIIWDHPLLTFDGSFRFDETRPSKGLQKQSGK